MQGMIGVIVNTAAVLLGSAIGLVFRRGIPEKIVSAVMAGMGLCTVYIGVSGVINGADTLIVVAAMALGAAAGTLLKIDGGLNALSRKLGGAVSAGESGRSRVADGFVTASLLFCVGSMTVTGSLTAGVTGDNSVIFTKSLMDFISSIMLSASLGVGVIFSAAFVLVFQGALVLLAGSIQPVLTQYAGAVDNMTCVGSILIIALGLNILGVLKLKVADYLPAIVAAPLLTIAVQLIKTLC